MVDDFSARYGDLLSGSYDCVDRIVLNAYFTLGHSSGGFRTWWRRLHGDDEELDNTHLMRLAGRFSRRVRAFAKAPGIPVIDCKSGERKHRIAEEHLARAHRRHRGVPDPGGPGAGDGVGGGADQPGGDPHPGQEEGVRQPLLVPHHGPALGPCDRQDVRPPPVRGPGLLNGHEYVACTARAAGIAFTKEGNCFTEVADRQGLARVADTLSQQAAGGRLSQVCDRWIYSACLCFGLDSDEQERSAFRYSYSVYQVEYSRNLLFRVGGQMERIFDAVVDCTRSRLDVATLRTLFGTKHRRINRGGDLSPRLGVVIETPRHDLTLFKVHFGLLTLKGYTKGEHVLRFEAIVHNTQTLGVGRMLERFPEIVARLGGMVERFCAALDCVDVGFIPDGTLDHLPLASEIGAIRVGGIDLNRPRMRSAMAAILALSAAPEGFTVGELAARVQAMTGRAEADYTVRQAAYDLRKFRGKRLVVKPGRSRRYQMPPDAARTMTALLVLRDEVIAPIVAGCRVPRHRHTTGRGIDNILSNDGGKRLRAHRGFD